MKRFLWSVSGIVSALLLAFAGAASPAHAISPVSTGNLTPAHLVVYYSNANSQSCSNISGSAIRCTFGKQGGLSATEITGIDIELPRFLPEYTYTTFQVSLTFNEYPAKVEYTGFTTDFDSTLVNQEVTWNAYQNLSFQMDTFATAGVTRIALRPQNGKGSALYYEWGPSTSYTITVSAIHYFEDIPGPEFVDFMNVVKSAIKDGNFNVNVDNSDVTSAIGSASDQAHKDSQAQLEESKKQTVAMEETKNFITDSSTPEAGDIANSDTIPSSGLLPDGPLDSILLLPVNILNSIIQSFGGTCSPVEAELPYVGEKIVFPCFADTFYTGAFAPLATAIGGVSSAFILYGYFKHLYKKVDRAVSMETTDEDEWGIL